MSSKTFKIVLAGDSDGAQKAARDTGDAVDKMATDTDKAGGRWSGSMDKMGVAVAGFAGAAAVGFAQVAKSFQDAMDAEKGSDKLAAQLGIFNPEEQARLGGIAGNLYANAYGDSLGTVNEAIRQVAQNGLFSEGASSAEIEGITAKVLDLSEAFGTDLNMTTQAVGQMMRTGLASNATEAMDVITRGMQQGGDKAGDLMETMQEYGTQFRQLGLDGAGSMGLLTQAVKAGARDSDTAADALKEFAIRGQDMSATSVHAFQELGLSAQDMAAKIAAGGPGAAEALDMTLDKLRAMEPGAYRTGLAVELFGTKAEDMQQALYAMDPSSATDALGNIAGAAERTGDILNDNAGTRLEEFKRTLETGLVRFLGDTVVPAVSALADAVIPVADAVGGFFSSVGDPASGAGAKFAEFGAKLSDTFGQVSEFASTTGEIFSTVWDRWGSVITEFVQGGLGSLQDALGGVVDTISSMVAVVTSVISGDWGAAWDNFKDAFVSQIGVVRDLLAGLGQLAVGALVGLGGAIVTWAETALPNAWGALQRQVPMMFEWIGQFVRELPGRLWDIQWAIGEWIIFTAVPWLHNTAVEWLPKIFGWFATEAVPWMLEKLQGIQGAIFGWFLEMPGKIASVSLGMFDGIGGAFESMLNTIVGMWNRLEIPSFTIGGWDTPFGTTPTWDTPRIPFPDIPALATGGVIDRPTLALLGETSRARPEIVSPAPMMRGIVRDEVRGAQFGGGGLTVADLRAALRAELAHAGQEHERPSMRHRSSQPQRIVLEVSGHDFGGFIIDSMRTRSMAMR